MLAPVTHILPLTVIERTRLLPVPGEVLVRAGQKVRANETVASAIVKPRHMMINIAKGLGVPENKASQYIDRDMNEMVAEGDILATRSGFGKRVVRAPSAGKITFISGPYLMIEVQTEPLLLKAALPGVVANLVPEMGVVIETTGALIQGVWGNGQIEYGLMNVAAKNPDDVLKADQIDVSMRGSVILAGICMNAETLRAGAEQRLRGLILGGLASDLVGLAQKMPYAIVALDGLGQQPMNEAAFKLLSTNEKREVAVNGEPYDPVNGNRPEIIIPLPGHEQLDYPQQKTMFDLGQKVLITRAPNRGKVGQIESIYPGLVTFPSGLRLQAASVRLSKDKAVRVPLENLEVLA